MKEQANNNLLLSLKNVTKKFGGLMAIRDMTVDIQKGELVSIIGPNGAGKSTLINVITGFLPITRGEIWFKGRKLSGLPAYRICNLGIARTFQDMQLFSNMNVIENVMVGAERWSKSSLLEVMAGFRKARREERDIANRAMEKLAQVGLESKAYSMLSTLTAKERKFLCIARALATEPVFLLLDEPVAGLSTEEIDEVATFIVNLQKNGMTILLVEHRVEMVMNISRRVVVLNFGEMIADDIPAKVQENQKVITAYLGENLL